MIDNLSSVSLVNYENAHYEQLSYLLDERQRLFTKSVYENIKIDEVQKIDNKYPVTILYDENPVGFFLLDRSEDRLLITNNPNAVLLRGLSLNPVYQGKGIAKRALLLADSFVKRIAQDIDEIVLTVNVENLNAYQLYRKINYKDTNRFKNGHYGLQHILFKRI